MMIVAAVLHSRTATVGMAAQGRHYLINGIAPLISISHRAQIEIEKTRILHESMVAQKNY